MLGPAVASITNLLRGSDREFFDLFERADQILAELQDSMMPVEVGDRELREGLSAVRETIAELPARARQLMRAQGR